MRLSDEGASVMGQVHRHAGVIWWIEPSGWRAGQGSWEADELMEVALSR